MQGMANCSQLFRIYTWLQKIASVIIPSPYSEGIKIFDFQGKYSFPGA